MILGALKRRLAITVSFNLNYSVYRINGNVSVDGYQTMRENMADSFGRMPIRFALTESS